MYKHAKQEAQESESNRQIKRADASPSRSPVAPSSHGSQHCSALRHQFFLTLNSVPHPNIDMLRSLTLPDLLYLIPDTSNFVINSQLERSHECRFAAGSSQLELVETSGVWRCLLGLWRRQRWVVVDGQILCDLFMGPVRRRLRCPDRELRAWQGNVGTSEELQGT